MAGSGTPRFITHDYIDLARIGAISRFRSAESRDYSVDRHLKRCDRAWRLRWALYD